MRVLQILLGLAVLAYVAYCLITQKVWIRKVFALGTLIAAWLVARPLLTT